MSNRKKELFIKALILGMALPFFTYADYIMPDTPGQIFTNYSNDFLFSIIALIIAGLFALPLTND